MSIVCLKAMESEYDSKEQLLSHSKQNISAKNNLIVHPPTPPVAKIRAMKQHHRLSCDRLTSSTTPLDSSFEITPAVHLVGQKGRRESTDSGLASVGANKRQSVDSEVLSRQTTQSEHSSPGDGVIGARSKNSTRYSSANHLEEFASRDEGLLPVYSGNASDIYGKPANEKYLSTASDKAADIEVSTIMKIPLTPESESGILQAEYDLNPYDKRSVGNGMSSQIDHFRVNDRSPIFHRKIDVASLLRHNERHNGNLHKGKRAFDYESKQSQSYCDDITNLDYTDISQDARHSPRNRQATQPSEYLVNENGLPDICSSTSCDHIASVNSFSDLTYAGISSSDTRRSSIRYEPVLTEHHPYHPPSPGPRANCRNLSRPSQLCLEGADSEPEDISTDVTVREEEMPLTSGRHRDPSPSSDHSSHIHIREPTNLPRNNPERLYNPKSATSYIEKRHTGRPRMGTGFVPVPSSHSSNYLPSSSMHNQQNPSALAAHMAPSSVPDAEFSVVTTALKLSHEEDESGSWMFSRGAEPDRPSHIVGFPANVQSSRNTSSDHSNNTAARFMNKPPTFGARHPYDPALRHRSRDNHNGPFKSIKKRCSWKIAAICFLVTSMLLLLAFAAVFIVNPFASNVPLISEVVTPECVVVIDTTTSTALVNIEGSSTELQMRRSVVFDIPPSTFKWMQIYVEEPTHIKFNFTVSADAQFAVYGRKGLRPSHTKFDFFEKIDGNTLPATSMSFIALTTTSNHRSRSKRSLSAGAQVQTEFLEYMDAGTWHLAVFNDQDQDDTFELTTSISKGLSTCPNSCSNNGDCENGICKCFHGFQGNDCSQVSCAVTCRGNGVYAQGRCVCFSGWKGMDCGTPSNRCIDPECGGHGECSPDGQCICENRFKGESCTEVDCIDPYCSGHGLCVEGTCRCDRGWQGSLCSEKDLVCLSNCGGHGTFNSFNQNCICDPGWAGIDCSIASCRPTCDLDHGNCVDGQCRCHNGWTGAACDQRQCPERCKEHGSCVRGMCVCDAGWNGNLCTFAGCPNDCSGEGDCMLNPQGDWYCSCRSGRKGIGCSIKVEVNCGDGKDNDMDTLIDCQDPDCCSHRSCSRTSQCRGGLDPVHEVTSNQARFPTPPTASFYDRVKFLIHRNGVQDGAVSNVFLPKRASVIRGQVLTSDGSPLVGVNVQVRNQHKYGSTKTRSDGWYDLMVNGGSSVVLTFQRPSFLAASTDVFVPWNEFVVAPSVTMKTPREPSKVPQGLDGGNSCDVSLLSPPSASVLVTTVRAYTAAECEEKGSIVPEMQAVREAVTLPSSKASLVYLSSRSIGYKSFAEILLIDGEKPLTLREVYVKVTAQGKEYEKRFEPVSDLTYTFEWNREDAYGQKVYGTVNSEVLVGYLYDNCPQILWKKLRTTLQGHDPSLEQSLASWSLDIQHTYHPDKGVVYLGGGGEMRLLEQPPMIATVMGDGHSRHVTCDRCDGPASTARLLSPVALTSDGHGNIYIGDHDHIRKLDTSGNISSLFSTRSPPTKYYMAVSPSGSQLYFSDPNQKKIFRLRRMSMPKNRHFRDVTSNFELVAGSGASCYPLQEEICGDGGQATSARLTSPKGLAFDASGRLYFVDGSRIRTVEPHSQAILTYTGRLSATGTRPLQCSGSMSVDQLELNYPTDLAINPRDGSLFVLDQEVVIKIDLKTRHASLVAGVPPHCARKVAKDPDDRNARKVHLVSPTSISVSFTDGSLYVAETDQSFIHRIRRIDPFSGRIATVAGVDSNCDCATQECQCFGGDGDFARSASLHNPISITASPDGSVYVADQLNLRIRKGEHITVSTNLGCGPTDRDETVGRIYHFRENKNCLDNNLTSFQLPKLQLSLPKIWHSLPAKTNNQYQVSDPDTNQLYVFDVNGRHLMTNNVITNSLLYRFSYSADGFLTTATDVNDNALRISYASGGRPEQLALPSGDVIGLTIEEGQALTKISKGSSTLASFTYHDDDTGLLRSSVRGRFATIFYVYDSRGRLISVTSPTGIVTSLHALANSTSQTVTMKTVAPSAGDDDYSQIGVGRRDVIITTEPGYLCDIITIIEGAMRTVYKRWTDNSISVHYLDNSELILETKPHPVLGLTTPSLAKRTIQLPADPLESKIEWKTRKEEENGYSLGQVLLGRRMRVNGRNILSLDFSQGMMMEKIYDDHTKFMLRVQYNDRGLPYLWMPNGGIAPVNVTYDARGHAITWQRGGESERILYDRSGNRQRSELADGSVWRYKYSDKVASVTLPDSNLQYDFTYDENENLQRIRLPSGLSYNINQMVGVGFIRTSISGPNGVTMYIQDENDIGNLLSTSYPGEQRKVLYRYDVHGHVTEILHDATMIKMLRDSQSGELVSLATDGCTLRYHRNGPLVQRHVITSTQNKGLLATFDYTHDINLRLSSIEVRINGTHLPVELLTYNDVSGKLTTFGPYRIIDMSSNIYAIGNEHFTLSKQFDNSGRLTASRIEAYGIVVFRMNVEYNAGGRVSRRESIFELYSNVSSYDYHYDQLGSLVRVDYNDQPRWNYAYDNDGQLVGIENDISRTAFRYDSHGRLSSMGDVSFVYDRDGFLQQRGHDVFEYDSLGHLVKAYRNGRYEISYSYDGLGRLTTRVDVLHKHVVRYLYGNIQQPEVLTHIYNVTSGIVSTLRYDVEGHLFAINHSDGVTWSIVCDHIGSPIAVLDRTTSIIKMIRYTAFGRVIFDSNPGLILHIGFRGGIYEADTKLVHFLDRNVLAPLSRPEISSAMPLGLGFSSEGKSTKLFDGADYDSLSGQFTSSGIKSLTKLDVTSLPLRLHQVNDPVNLHPKNVHMTDTKSWLDALGFKLQNVAPDPHIASRQKDKSSAECQLSRHLSSYMNMQTATPSVLVPESYTNNAPGGAMLAQGLVISIDRGQVSTQVTDTATDDIKRFSSVVSGAQVLIGQNADSPLAPMSLTHEGKPVLYLTKPASSFARDKQTMQIPYGRQKTLQSAYGHGSDATSHLISLRLQGSEMRAESGYGLVVIFYVDDGSDVQIYDVSFTTAEEERRHVWESAKKQAESEAWLREKRKIQNGLKTNWTLAQQQEILSQGRLEGYTIRQIWNCEVYPEFSDSGRNVEFIRET